MYPSWRHFRTGALLAALALLPGPALALDAAELEEMESLLRDLGFHPGPVDGVVDDDTIAAIRRYQEFAALPGEPLPSALLLSELRGVAAAFAALAPQKQETPPTAPDTGAAQPDNGGSLEAVAEKVVVPPPPPPPKLHPPEEEAAPAETAPAEPPAQLAELPPADAPPEETPPEAQAEEAPAETEPPAAEAPAETPPDPAAEVQARIDEELAPYRRDLDSGSLSREELAKRFNAEGRQAMGQADYATAVLKFSVAIYLNPRFPGAYSNRGTAYQQQDETELAAEDFAKAKQLGFGGLRIRDGSNPFN